MHSAPQHSLIERVSRIVPIDLQSGRDTAAACQAVDVAKNYPVPAQNQGVRNPLHPARHRCGSKCQGCPRSVPLPTHPPLCFARKISCGSFRGVVKLSAFSAKPVKYRPVRQVFTRFLSRFFAPLMVKTPSKSRHARRFPAFPADSVQQLERNQSPCGPVTFVQGRRSLMVASALG